ncbi:hypothetical protein B0H11DRAFT_1907770 [Mycena galericulata]|nr:hypothetical protein B0H11DRAFT_1907770 [Mycena galericulata]
MSLVNTGGLPEAPATVLMASFISFFFWTMCHYMHCEVVYKLFNASENTTEKNGFGVHRKGHGESAATAAKCRQLPLPNWDCRQMWRQLAALFVTLPPLSQRICRHYLKISFCTSLGFKLSNSSNTWQGPHIVVGIKHLPAFKLVLRRRRLPRWQPCFLAAIKSEVSRGVMNRVGQFELVFGIGELITQFGHH